jgi:hypothetical protein
LKDDDSDFELRGHALELTLIGFSTFEGNLWMHPPGATAPTDIGASQE